MCSSNLSGELLKSEASKWAIPVPSWTPAKKSNQLTMESYSKLSYYFMQACLGYNRVQIEDFKMQERQTRALLPYMPSFITALEHNTQVLLQKLTKLVT